MSLIYFPHSGQFEHTWAVSGNAGAGFDVFDEQSRLVAHFDSAREATQFAHDVWVK